MGWHPPTRPLVAHLSLWLSRLAQKGMVNQMESLKAEMPGKNQ